MNPIKLLKQLFPNVPEGVWYVVALLLVMILVVLIWRKLNPLVRKWRMAREMASLGITTRLVVTNLALYMDNHDSCQADMPLFFDLLQDAKGPGDRKHAIEQYPHVFWHILSCDDCHETAYHTLMSLGLEEEAYFLIGLRTMIAAELVRLSESKR